MLQAALGCSSGPRQYTVRFVVLRSVRRQSTPGSRKKNACLTLNPEFWG
jgi:hypothetical protein